MEKKTTKRTSKQVIEMTLLNAFETIENSVLFNGIDDKIIKKIRKELDHVKSKFDINDNQAILLTTMLRHDEGAHISDIAEDLCFSNIKILCFQNDIDDLKKKRIIATRTERPFNRPKYIIRSTALEAIKSNSEFKSDNFDNLSSIDLIKMIETQFALRCEGTLSYDEFCNELTLILKSNKSQTLCKSILDSNMEQNDMIVLLGAACRWILHEERDNYNTILNGLFNTTFDKQRIWNSLKFGHSILIKKNILEPACNDGVVDNSNFCITQEAANTFLADYKDGLSVNTQKDNSGLISSESISEKVLYFNDTNSVQIDELKNILMPSNFVNVQGRMRKMGMRTGFACLFHGGPGTGKTELVMQLARETGRDLMQINISEIKDKWVGESEKNIKAVFDRYRKKVESMDVTPILFFNEADGIFGKRIENTRHSVDKMENSIQNIILQEIENMKGILIATTNLTCNLDSAFERRFLYKIAFETPNATTRAKIWKDMMPWIDESGISRLAKQYEFSGGQIENIARKSVINYVLHNTQTSYDEVNRYCQDEKISKAPSTSRVGFQV